MATGMTNLTFVAYSNALAALILLPLSLLVHRLVLITQFYAIQSEPLRKICFFSPFCVTILQVTKQAST